MKGAACNEIQLPGSLFSSANASHGWDRKGKATSFMGTCQRAGDDRLAQTDDAVTVLLRRFYALQGERVEAYRLFEEGHRAYLSSGPHYDFLRYRQLVHEITLGFNGISREILQIKEQLQAEHGRPELAQHLARVQEKEKEKLELVRGPQSPLLCVGGSPARFTPRAGAGPAQAPCPHPAGTLLPREPSSLHSPVRQGGLRVPAVGWGCTVDTASWELG
ncbi:required for excision 1-B domain-containing protein isoform X1 [Emydura macquarii macquarii]|uniref:required for excision 1-B domain-containing protein isoform X1 n=1 Tax=Emydura macquarii macquarii TaxID=1129001 RepID=UPI00352B6CE4